ncbi:MAG: L,D-transpeptidase, partial [Rhodobacteraceae bacterium]|nr:L,D-transpeptidase [Paracoccaceae bacterium]
GSPAPEASPHLSSDQKTAAINFDPARIYAPVEDSGIAIPGINYRKLRPDLLRARVDAPKGAVAGSLVVQLASCHLFLIEPDGGAIRYGIGIGRQGFDWSGRGVIARKKPWPRWTPPREMVARVPALSAYQDGKSGGIDNPLGARALYIYENGADTLYRVHGTPEWWTIGRATSSGCLRMLNQDIIDLYARVDIGTPIVVA